MFNNTKTFLIVIAAIIAQILSLFHEIGPIGISCSIFLLVSLLTSAVMSNKSDSRHVSHSVENSKDKIHHG